MTIEEAYNKGRADMACEIQDAISEVTWYHLHNGRLCKGANSLTTTPLYKWADICKAISSVTICRSTGLECCECTPVCEHRKEQDE